MATQFPEIFAALAAPFEEHELRTRTIPAENGRPGRKESYITARTAMNRLDNTVGPEAWEDDYVTFGANGGVKCWLTLTLPDGRKVRKSGLGGTQKMKDSSNDEKTGESDALKRAAVKFGVARYLYRDGVPAFVADRTGLTGTAAPVVYEPGAVPGSPGEVPCDPASATTADGPAADRPRTGKEMFAWAKEQEQRYEVGLLKYLTQWARLQDFPGRMIDWNVGHVRLAHAEAERKLAAYARERESSSYDEAISN